MTQRGAGRIIVATILLAAGFYVWHSLQRPAPPEFAPSPVGPRPAGEVLVGPRLHTVDARDGNRWSYFSFARGSVMEDPGPFEWDLAFRRFQMMVNGGEGFRGMGGVVDLGEVPLDSVPVVPETGYEGTAARGDSVAPALRDWYRYSFFTHVLSPRPRTYAVRTADGRYALVRFKGYYCPEARPGCVTFEYLYQGAGGRKMDRGPGSAPASSGAGADDAPRTGGVP